MKVKCFNCGKEFDRWPSCVKQHNFCCRQCAKVFTSSRMKEYNEIHNPESMDEHRRMALRLSRIGKGEGKTYAKTFGRHTHRIVAEQMLGRPLKKGEVVHHINGDKRDNDPANLMVFVSQAEHAKWHEKFDGNPKTKQHVV